MRLRATTTLVRAVSSLGALSWRPCPSPLLTPEETLGSVRRARQQRRLNIVPFLEALPRCLGCRPEERWVGCLARLGGETWGARLSCAGCCCGHEHPGRYVLHHQHLFGGVFFKSGYLPLSACRSSRHHGWRVRRSIVVRCFVAL